MNKSKTASSTTSARNVLIWWIKTRSNGLCPWHQYREIFTMFPLEKLTTVVRGNVAVFEQVWLLVVEHLATYAIRYCTMFKTKYTF